MAEDICFWAKTAKSSTSTTAHDMKESGARCVICKGRGQEMKVCEKAVPTSAGSLQKR